MIHQATTRQTTTNVVRQEFKAVASEKPLIKIEKMNLYLNPLFSFLTSTEKGH